MNMNYNPIVPLALCLGLLSAAGCTQLPSLESRVPSHAIDAPDTRLARATAPKVAAHPELSGLHSLVDGRSAFAARRILVEAADRTLDVQYHI
jgi:putative cardiolipin synthase